MNALVLNCGSSSIKFRVYAAPGGAGERELCHGAVEGIGVGSGELRMEVAGREAETREQRVADHADGLRLACEWLAANGFEPELVAHRVVHGGARFNDAALVDDGVLEAIERLSPLAPLHNPVNLLGVRAAREHFADARHVAVFDTAFHQTAPDHATRYAIPTELATEHGVRRYGFHGSSHAWSAGRAAELLGRPVAAVKTVVLHLGAGASACAIDGGRSVDTSMGMTPLEGLVMATRSGDLDPSVVLFLQRERGLSVDEVDRLLNRQSGLLGYCGDGDLREVLRRADAGDADARLALDAYVYRIAKYVGAYTVALGGLDALVFTAGVGERSAPIREAVVGRLGALGLKLDAEANSRRAEEDRAIHAPDSSAAVLVVAANEELQIARTAARRLAGA